MTGPARVTRSTPESACEWLLAFEHPSVLRNADLVDVLQMATRRATMRLIGVVDDDGRLVGVIPIRDLVEAVVARTIPEALMTEAVDIDSVAQFGHVDGSRTAADVMLIPAAVTADATIARGFPELSHPGARFLV